MEDTVTWYQVSRWPGYQVSREGRVLSPRGRLLSPYRSGGYLAVKVWDGRQLHTVHVHQVVADAFLGPCPEGYEVNHKDLDKANNASDNLEYLTHRANMHHYAAAQGFTCHPPYRLPPEQWQPVPARLARAMAYCQALAAMLPAQPPSLS